MEMNPPKTVCGCSCGGVAVTRSSLGEFDVSQNNTVPRSCSTQCHGRRSWSIFCTHDEISSATLMLRSHTHKRTKRERERESVNNCVLTSCQPHRFKRVRQTDRDTRQTDRQTDRGKTQNRPFRNTTESKTAQKRHRQRAAAADRSKPAWRGYCCV